jgi:hypothetical protein
MVLRSAHREEDSALKETFALLNSSSFEGTLLRLIRLGHTINKNRVTEIEFFFFSLFS